MAYSCKILADSRGPTGCRLTTFEITYPRFVHSELMTHREFSRNTSSSRAIPIEKMIARVLEDPVLPQWWGKNQAGMSAREELDANTISIARTQWLRARDRAVETVNALTYFNLHKQIVNRLLEPWMWITAIVSSTNYKNFFHLRCHPDAQPEIRVIAEMMRHTLEDAEPTPIAAGDWHLPLVTADELASLRTDQLKKISVGRCARVSYLTHNGTRDPNADIDLHNRLMQSGHWSPFEHVAMALTDDVRSGNFSGFFQYRKFFSEEYVPACPILPAIAA